MNYFSNLATLLEIEQREDQAFYNQVIAMSPVSARRSDGICWYPVALRDTTIGAGDYLTLELERTTHLDLPHQFRFGASVALFSNHNPLEDRIEGVISFQGENRLKISLRIDELPEWTGKGKLGVDLLADTNSYREMQKALKQAATTHEKDSHCHLVKILTGEKQPAFNETLQEQSFPNLNPSQQTAVNKILSANDLAIIHGPPGTGKTTTLIAAIKAIIARDKKQILVVAPSNTAVDLLSEKLSVEGLEVLRIGNPARVSEKLMALTADQKMAGHSQMKEIKNMKKRANEFRSMAHKYKRNFGKAEREQRKALFEEAHRIIKDVERTEEYIMNDLLSQAQVITATLVGANHYTVRHLTYDTVVIDEAGQALEPACWIPILKAKKVVLAGDHCQLPPTVKSVEAGIKGLNTTLLEKCISLHPQAVTLLNEQYRMHMTIMGYSSETFYSGKLLAHNSVAFHTLYPGDSPFLFIDTAGCGFDEKAEGTSITNPEEASFLWKHLTCFLEDYQAGAKRNTPSIAIISPYKQQVEILREQGKHITESTKYRNNISINTIDSFQGQERDMVYISMVRSNMEGQIGFLSDIRRMNVAMTRARKKLVVIGDSTTLSRFAFYSNLIDYADKHNAYQSAWEYNSI